MATKNSESDFTGFTDFKTFLIKQNSAVKKLEAELETDRTILAYKIFDLEKENSQLQKKNKKLRVATFASTVLLLGAGVLALKNFFKN